MTWNFANPFPSLPRGDIFPFSARAPSWLARPSKDSTFLQNRCVQIALRYNKRSDNSDLHDIRK
jgi:hypothetical protein